MVQYLSKCRCNNSMCICKMHKSKWHSSNKFNPTCTAYKIGAEGIHFDIVIFLFALRVCIKGTPGLFYLVKRPHRYNFSILL